MDDGKMAFGAIGILMTLAMFTVSIILFLLGHFYIVNGLMVGFLPFVIMSTKGYSAGVCLAVYGLIVLVSVVLQLNFKSARVIYGIISCGIVAFFIWDIYKELPLNKQLLYIGIGTVITAFLNLMGYCREDELE